MKIALDIGPKTTGDSIRGIGMYVDQLSKHLSGVDFIDARKSDLSKYDIVHLTRFNPFFVSVPLNKPKHTKFILTIYDLIPLIYPKYYFPGIRGNVKFLINKYLIAKNVDAIITISETSKKDICRFLGADPKKVHVTYLAPREIFKKITNPSYPGLPNKFAFYVGDLNYNKNIPNLLKACEMCDTPLVIAGKEALDITNNGIKSNLKGPKDFIRYILNKPHPELTHYSELLKSFKSNKKVIKLGFVADEDLVKIYNLASVYVQASFYEGFGLPILEGYVCGTPIAVSKNQCHREILGQNFSYFNPLDPKDIARAILNPNRNKALPREYSWSKVARQTQRVYDQA